MKGGRPPIPREIAAEVVRLRRAGSSWGEIGRELGMHRQTARSVYQRETTRATVYENSQVPAGRTEP